MSNESKDVIQWGDKQYSPEEFQKILALGQKNDTVQSGFAQNPHGYSQQWTSPPEGGLLTRPGQDPFAYSAVPSFSGTLLEMLPLYMSRFQTPEYTIITGVDDPSGSNPTSFGGTPPVIGDLKVGTHRSSFGKFFLGSQKVTVNEIGGRVNAGDTDIRVINNFAAMSKIVPDIARDPNINSWTGTALYSFSIAAHRKISKCLFEGNTLLSNSNTDTGFIKEFDGLDKLHKTGYVDLESGNAMTAADSVIENFASAEATTAANGIVELVSYVYDELTHRADKAGLAPLVLAISMPRNMFRALTEVWPTSYLTTNNAVTTANGERLNISGYENVNMRDDMYNGLSNGGRPFLWVRGVRVPVTIEDGITETLSGNGAGLKAPMYFTPMVAGGRMPTYLEAFDQNNADIQEFLQMSGADNYRTTNGGFWAVSKNATAFNREWFFGAQPRLVSRTPYLGAIIQNVAYTLSNGYHRHSDPTNAYYANGGRYTSNPYSGG